MEAHSLDKIGPVMDGTIQMSDLREGVWCVRKIPSGKQMTFVMEKVSDLPEALELTRLESIRYDMSKAIVDYLVNVDTSNTVLEEFNKHMIPLGVSIRHMVNAIFKTLRTSKNVKK